MNNELHARAHCGSVGQTTRLAFAHVKRGLGQVVFNEFHLDKAVVRDDGKSRFECRLQAFMRALLRGRICLQKSRIGVFLHLQQIRNF